MASSTSLISELADGVGQELFNAIILGAAVLMLAWHNILMASHGKELTSKAQNIGNAIRDSASDDAPDHTFRMQVEYEF